MENLSGIADHTYNSRFPLYKNYTLFKSYHFTTGNTIQKYPKPKKSPVRRSRKNFPLRDPARALCFLINAS